MALLIAKQRLPLIVRLRQADRLRAISLLSASSGRSQPN